MTCVLREVDEAATATLTVALLVRYGVEGEPERFWTIGEDEVVARMFELVVVFKNKGDCEVELEARVLIVVFRAVDTTLEVVLEAVDVSEGRVLV